MRRHMGIRPLAVAVSVVAVLLYCVYSLSFPSNTPQKSFQDHTRPTSTQRLDSDSSPQQSPQILAPPRPLATPPPEERSACFLTKVSMLYGTHKFPQLEDALDSHRQHCEHWGCGFESLDQDLTGRKLYSKHYFLLSTMLHELSKPAEERKEWLMWVDADSIVINPAISPCTFLPPDELEDVFALVTADHQGLNNGIFYLRIHRSSIDLLTQIIDYPLAHPNIDLGWFGEQAAMANVINSTEAQLKSEGSPSRIAWVPREWFNTYQFEHGFEGRPGHFIVHFAGLAETRISHMADWLDELQRNQAKWEVPLEDTFYSAAVPEFWNEFAVNATK